MTDWTFIYCFVFATTLQEAPAVLALAHLALNQLY